jgi:hypothetical protein
MMAVVGVVEKMGRERNEDEGMRREEKEKMMLLLLFNFLYVVVELI